MCKAKLQQDDIHDDNLSIIDDDESSTSGIKKRPRRSTKTIEIGDVKISPIDFLEKMKLLESLEYWGRNQAGPNWAKLDSNELSVPQIIIDHMSEGKEQWNNNDCVNLLKLIHLHGYGYWTLMCADKQLCTGILKDLKHDRAKSRCIRLLKLLTEWKDGELKPKPPKSSRKRNEHIDNYDISNPSEVQSNSVPLDVPPDVTTSRSPAVSSSNLLSPRGKATPGDRGEGEGRDGSSIMGMMEDGSKDVLDVTSSGMKCSTGPQVEPAADLREAEGELNRRGSTPSGTVVVTSGGTSSGTTSHPLASNIGLADSSSNLLSPRGRATPGDRGEGSDVTSSGSGLPESDLRELEGEVNREADGRTTSGGTATMVMKDQDDIEYKLRHGRALHKDEYGHAVKWVLKGARDGLRRLKILKETNAFPDFRLSLENDDNMIKGLRNELPELNKLVNHAVGICSDAQIANKLKSACWRFISRFTNATPEELEQFANTL